MTQIILGSTSPRRRALLNQFKVPFIQVPPHFNEDTHPYNGDPIHYVNELAKLKRKPLVSRYKDHRGFAIVDSWAFLKVKNPILEVVWVCTYVIGLQVAALYRLSLNLIFWMRPC